MVLISVALSLLGMAQPVELACNARTDVYGIGRVGILERTKMRRKRIDLLPRVNARRLKPGIGV